jgi:hypothetical protein
LQDWSCFKFFLDRRFNREGTFKYHCHPPNSWDADYCGHILVFCARAMHPVVDAFVNAKVARNDIVSVSWQWLAQPLALGCTLAMKEAFSSMKAGVVACCTPGANGGLPRYADRVCIIECIVESKRTEKFYSEFHVVILKRNLEALKVAKRGIPKAVDYLVSPFSHLHSGCATHEGVPPQVARKYELGYSNEQRARHLLDLNINHPLLRS